MAFGYGTQRKTMEKKERRKPEENITVDLILSASLYQDVIPLAIQRHSDIEDMPLKDVLDSVMGCFKSSINRCDSSRRTGLRRDKQVQQIVGCWNVHPSSRAPRTGRKSLQCSNTAAQSWHSLTHYRPSENCSLHPQPLFQKSLANVEAKFLTKQ